MLQSAVHEIVKEHAKQSAPEAFALLQQEPWSESFHFQTAVDGYLAGLPRRADWRQVRADLNDLVTERARSQTAPDDEGKHERAERAGVDQAVASEWARRDLNAAMDWYLHEAGDENSRSGEQRALIVLQAASVENRYRAADWLQAALWSGEADEQLVVKHATQLAYTSPDATVERLAAMPEDEANRSAIVAAFATPQEHNGRRYLRFPPEDLARLIDAARLSEAERERWRETIAGVEQGRE